MRGFGLGGERVDETDKLRLGLGLGHEADDDGDDEVGAEGEDCAPEVLRHVAGVVVDHGDPAAVNAGVRFYGQGEAVVQHGRGGSGDEAGECTVAGGALPEHAQQESGEERRIDEAED